METTAQNQTNSANIQAFIRQAGLITDRKIFFNKPFLKRLNVLQKCTEIAEQYLGKDINYLHGDYQSVVLYIEDTFGDILREEYGENAYRILEDDTVEGGIQLSMEQGLLFYHKINSMNIEEEFKKKALGLLYYMAGHQLDDEFSQISKVAPRGLITPSFELSSRYFRWKRCNHVLRKYMLQLSIPEGYQGYYFEKTALPQIAYMTNSGISISEAEEELKTTTGGIFHPFLDLNLESKLISLFLTGGANTEIMKGHYTQTYLRDTARIEKELPVGDMYNVYNFMVKPIMIDLMGMIINNVNSEAAKNHDLSHSDWFIYHVSQDRIGVLVREGMTMEDVSPNLGRFFVPVPEFDLAQIPNGEFI